MDERCERLCRNTLTAEELLRNKGIRGCVWEEWERSTQILPKSGKKHFEPNNSWLQNVQIEKGLKNRRDLLNIERVNRISELASAEWMPVQKKALVTKRSGQDWSNFGLEKNGSLYLIPEEALFLLETNCLELVWNGVPCSIQQAYEILIDDSVCTLEEYRVYSQLIRYGYRIQRYLYTESEKCNRLDESTPIKRKVIVDPENGLRMCDGLSQNQQATEKSMDISLEDVEKTDKSSISPIIESCQNAVVEQVIYDIMDHLLCGIEDRQDINNITPEIIESNTLESNINSEEKNRNTKLEIISDETLLGNIKILRDVSSNSTKEEITTSKWPGSRIQRNVKLLPKRNDKTPPAEVSIIDSDYIDGNSRSLNLKKRRTSPQTNESPSVKKSKHEVIELSDDEIQELPRPMTRMEMLNLLPNIATQSNITEEIPMQYIPHNIRPRKSTVKYSLSKMLSMQENDKNARKNCKDIRNNARQNAFQSNTASNRSPAFNNRSNPLFQNQNARSHLYGPSRPFYPMNQIHGTNICFPYAYNNRFNFNYGQDSYAQNRITLMQQNIFHNMFVAFENHSNAVQQRSLTIQMNNFAMPILGGYRVRHPFMENQLRHSFYQNFSWQQRFYQRRMENASTHSNTYPIAKRRCEDAGRSSVNQADRDVNRPSFTTRPGTSSWTELKKKWSEEKTIVIDDEDYKNKEECSEVQVVEQFVNPLVGPRNASSLADVFSKLAIIKSAPEKIVRRKKSKYQISYNIYSCTQHYKKANPGKPLYSLVVIRKENSFLQPVELNRLQQDAKGCQIIIAYVSMSISYVQPGIITTPNMI